MNQKFKRILSLFLSLLMGMSALPAYAAPEQAADQSSTTSQTAETNTETNKTAAKQKISASGSITVGDEQVPFSMDESDINAAMVADNSEDTTVDTSDPAVKSVKKELKNIRVKSTKADGTEEKKKLTAEQQQQVLVMFQNYQDNWKANADVLGAQLPFYMQYNDKGEDGLGVLGEMLVLAGVTVDAVRNGDYSYDDLTGTIMTFMYGDQLGVKYYGDTVRSKRDDAIKAIKASGAKTEYQKLLVLNDWLASQDTFDMSYIMNMGKDTPTMAAENPKDPDHYKDVYDVVYSAYEKQITDQFHDQIYAGVEADLRQKFYENAIRQAIYTHALGDKTDETATEEEKTAANKQADTYMETNKDAISKDAAGFVKTNFGEETAQQMSEQADAFIKKAETEGIKQEDGSVLTVEQMTQYAMENKKVDLDGDGVEDMTPNQAIPYSADKAASQLAPAIINYWEGNQIGALAIGKSVCLGYSKAYAYLVQASHPEIYGKNGASTDMSKADNWKEAKDLYTFSSDGKKVNTDGNYSVDLVRITFKANVTMYGETQPDFNSDHFWNAVKVDGKWYYVDPCYTDCYSEVMTRDRVETDGYMNHMYFMFSDTTTRNLYDGYFKELNTAYQDVATDKTYEDAWFARAKSDVSSDGTNMYYVYDSTNLIKRLNDSQMDQMNSKEDPKYKLVSHPITNKDSGDGDTDYTTLIDFTYKPDSDKDDTVVQVYNPETKKMETNDMLTELYAKHAEQADIYPSIAITCAQYEGKLYFNLSNYILSYDLTSGKVATVKKYDTVYGKRDKTNAFGGMSFALVNSADGADFTFRDHPIAGISLKSDGKLYVSVATNLAYISGKDDVSNRTKPTDSKDYTIDSKDNGYGYEFEESNYNPDYSNYSNDKYSDSMMEQFGYKREINDNDEFMWVANLRGTEAMSSIAGESVEYKKETCDHHYIHFDETYFTKKKDSDGNKTDEWNTGESYVCTVCGKSVEEPTEPKKNSMGSSSDYEKKKAQYDKDKAEYDEVVKNAGHTYTAKDPKWTKNDDGTYSVTFDTLVCSSVCEKEKNQRDCLVNDDTITIKLNKSVTAQAEITKTEGSCTDENGVKVTYTATGEAEGHKYTVSNVVETGKGEHTLKSEFKWTKLKDGGYSATVSAKCEVCGAEEKDVQAEVTSVTKDATCTEDAQITYTAKATCLGQELTETKDAEVQEGTALGHKYKGEIKWSEDFKSADATFTCETCKDVQTVKADVTKKIGDATCTTGGKVTYTAKAELKDKNGKVLATATESKTVDVQALGHEYESKFDWAKDGSSAKLTLTCKRGDDKQTVDAVVTKDEKNCVAPTCTEAGKNAFTATATYEGKEYTDTKEVAVPALGHHYVDGVCDRCGAIKLPFTDVNEGDWFYDKVAYVYHHKLMTGTSETTFEPNATLTRAMMVQILYNKEGRPAATTNGNPYTDVPKDQWYYNAVQWAYENKITSGTSETTFEPNSEVTREQFARFMYNYAGNPAVSGKLDFVDADQVSDWAYDAMVWANQNNIILGKKKSDGSVVLDPRGNATRAEAATILMGYCKAQENQ